MATKKDLVEAHAFSRRRLVTAFVSGAPGGREVEPVRPGRIIVGGVALSVLLLAGAAIAGFLLGRPPAQWLETGSFIISKDTGEQYVVLRGGDDGVLQRVPNYVSAQLLLGEAELQPFTVRDKYIRTVQLGEDLGIEGAPAGLPDPDGLVHEGWTACTDDDTGVKVVVDREPAVEELRDQAFLVQAGATRWLIAPSPDVAGRPGRAYRFELPRDEVGFGAIADDLGFGVGVVRVDREWLNLFPMGGALDAAAFGITDRGAPFSADGAPDLARYSVGDLLRTPDGAYYLLGDDKPQRLSEFAGMVYDAVVEPAVTHPGEVRAAFAVPEYPDEWPEVLPAAAPAGPMCALLQPSAQAAPEVRLAHQPGESADPAGLEPGEFDVDVAPSGGAYVLSGSDQSATGGTPYVIDTKAQRYALVGSEVPSYIGYGDVEPPLVPSSWLVYFEPGVALSTQAARRVPEDAATPSEGDAG
ncbi:MAG: type VII secretion protein EccB [Nocardioides sp.]|nr:type VII secretion protein EccB [Nocardioides sp.]